MRDAAGPDSSASKTIPAFTRALPLPRVDWSKSREDRSVERVTCARWNHRKIHEPFVELISWMAVMIADNLVAGEGADRGSDEDVAGPMSVVVHARERDEPRAPVHRRADQPTLIGIPAAHLGRYRGCRRKGRNGVARWKRSV